MSGDLSEFEKELRHKLSDKDLFGIEKTLGLSRQRYISLLDEPSDWSFVIKLAVILEAALTQVIASRLDTPQLQQHLSRLNLGGRTGKLQLAQDLGVIDSIAASKIRAISEFRNVFAHDIDVLDKSLEQIIEAMPVRERTVLSVALIQMEGLKFKKDDEVEFESSQSRLMFWIGGGLALGLLARSFNQNDASRRWLAAQLLVSEAFFAQISGDRDTYIHKLKQALGTLEKV